tara:strand:- start:360 stop:539 length:180 start_codon:yes stop_codon:yes gene_type:complete
MVNGWKLIRKEKDFIVWRKGNKTISVYRGLFTTPSGRRQFKGTMVKGKTAALKYMRKYK